MIHNNYMLYNCPFSSKSFLEILTYNLNFQLNCIFQQVWIQTITKIEEALMKWWGSVENGHCNYWWSAEDALMFHKTSVEEALIKH